MTYPGYLNSSGIGMIQTIQVRRHHVGLISWNGVRLQGRFFLRAEAKAPTKKISSPAFAVNMYISKSSRDVMFGHLTHLRPFLPGNYSKRHPNELLPEKSGKIPLETL